MLYFNRVAQHQFISKSIFFVPKSSFQGGQIKNQIGEEGASGLGSGLGKCTNLSNLELNLRSNKIGDKGASSLGYALANCTNLSKLILDLRQKQLNSIQQ
ncbi:hypothetical protein ABPG74_006889 [Tetrahymena malaccensis]